VANVELVKSFVFPVAGFNRHPKECDVPPTNEGKKKDYQSNKDRSAHDSARGVATRRNTPLMRSLSKVFPSEAQINEIFADLETESDRGAALICGAFLDKILCNNLAARFINNASLQNSWFSDNGAVFGSFHARIETARALNCIGDRAYNELTLVRKIRNQFAHALLPLKFTDEPIHSECMTLPDRIPNDWDIKFSAPRARYMAICINLTVALSDLAEADNAARSGGTKYIHPSVNDIHDAPA
jgi:hypothetical protein